MRRGSGRGRAAVVTAAAGAAALATLLAGCGDQPPDPLPAPASTPTATAVGTPPAAAPAPVPASVAGGACHLLDYAVIAEHLDAEFDVSAARRRDDSHTCVVQAIGRSRPDLALTVTPTTADVATFVEDLTPFGATAVSGLGKAGYQVARPAADGAGPGVEVGWLSGDSRLLLLRFTLERGAPGADGHAAGLVALAKVIDRARL